VIGGLLLVRLWRVLRSSEETYPLERTQPSRILLVVRDYLSH
jgi:hypothetical protein